MKLKVLRVVHIVMNKKNQLKEKVGQDFMFNKKMKKKKLINGCK